MMTFRKQQVDLNLIKLPTASNSNLIQLFLFVQHARRKSDKHNFQRKETERESHDKPCFRLSLLVKDPFYKFKTVVIAHVKGTSACPLHSFNRRFL